jgi:murein DD-endopeptidase MepM/ murein hydrolase activator NlpD
MSGENVLKRYKTIYFQEPWKRLFARSVDRTKRHGVGRGAVESDSGLQTRFGHMSRLMVSRGQSVRKGEIIGYVGSTGLSTGPHLHYEVRFKGRALDPMPLLGSRGTRLSSRKQRQ